MLKVKTKIALISQTLLSIFRGILEVKKIKIKKRQTLYQEMTLRNNYYLDMTTKQKADQVLVNECSIIKTRFSEEKP